ncbi:hypothetical protein BRARA_I01485, partial [Brassica rapa]
MELLKDFLWRVMKKAIPISSNLERRGVPSFNCKNCGAHEDDLHVFLTCPMAEEVWSNIPTGPNLVSLPPVGLSSPLWPWVLWNLWKARNKLVFENRVFSAQEIVLKSIIDAKEWSRAQLPDRLPSSSIHSPVQTNHRAVTAPPMIQDGVLVCNVDAAWDAISGGCGIGGIFSGQSLSSLPNFSDSHSHVSSALMAEAIAVHRAVSLAVFSNVRSLAVLSDSLSLVNLLNKGETQPELF